MPRITILVISLGLASVVFSGGLRAQSISSEDSLIYSTLLTRIAPPNASKVLIRSSTRPDVGRGDAHSGLLEEVRKTPGVDSTAANSFQRAAKSPLQVKLFTIGKAAVELLDDSTTNVPRADGIVSVTGIGYNIAKTQAIVAVDYFCPGMCGGGWFAVLDKIEGAWHVSNKAGVIWTH